MKLRLLEFLRCVKCRGALTLENPAVETIDRPAGRRLPLCSGLCGSSGTAGAECPACARLEVITGTLRCGRCGGTYSVDEGIPRMSGGALADRVTAKAQTAERFGYLWEQASPDPELIPSGYHFEKLERALTLPAPAGIVLDAGAGEGIDLVNVARRYDVEAIGAELSTGGCRTTARRILTVPDAHIVQADLGRLPFGDRGFDYIYSYGVLHHMAKPAEGLAELSRVARPGGSVAIYLYEDFSDRSAFMRWWLRAANSLRHVTTRLPPRLLYVLCQAASPFVYATFTVPHLVMSRVPGLRGLAQSVPFRHGKGPLRLTGDLYDRFSAPVEYRYSREGSAAFMREAGLDVVRVGNDRGWMVLGTVPSSQGARL